jgi:hypothetical protein
MAATWCVHCRGARGKSDQYTHFTAGTVLPQRKRDRERPIEKPDHGARKTRLDLRRCRSYIRVVLKFRRTRWRQAEPPRKPATVSLEKTMAAPKYDLAQPERWAGRIDRIAIEREAIALRARYMGEWAEQFGIWLRSLLHGAQAKRPHALSARH